MKQCTTFVERIITSRLAKSLLKIEIILSEYYIVEDDNKDEYQYRILIPTDYRISFIKSELFIDKLFQLTGDSNIEIIPIFVLYQELQQYLTNYKSYKKVTV
jgi:hypothetical protein